MNHPSQTFSDFDQLFDHPLILILCIKSKRKTTPPPYVIGLRERATTIVLLFFSKKNLFFLPAITVISSSVILNRFIQTTEKTSLSSTFNSLHAYRFKYNFCNVCNYEICNFQYNDRFFVNL